MSQERNPGTVHPSTYTAAATMYVDQSDIERLRKILASYNIEPEEAKRKMKPLERGVSKRGEVVTFRCRPCGISLRGLPLAAANAFSSAHQAQEHRPGPDPDGLM